MKIKWIFTVKVIAAQVLFSLPLFILLLTALLSNNKIDFNDFKSQDLVVIWIAWISFPVIIVFVSSLVNKIFNNERYSILRLILQTFIGFVLGCFFAAISFAFYSSPFGVLLFLICPLILGSLNLSFNKKQTLRLDF